MLNAMGVYQHHDGITGTAKDPVAKNYYKHLDTAMATNNIEYGKILERIAKDEYGIKLATNLNTCVFDQGTFLDCPTQSVFGGDIILVASHNPSTVTQKVQRVKVPS